MARHDGCRTPTHEHHTTRQRLRRRLPARLPLGRGHVGLPDRGRRVGRREGRSIWDVFAHTPGKTLHGDTGDVACDAYDRARLSADGKQPVMRRNLRNIFHRLVMSEQDVKTLRGAVVRLVQGPRRRREHDDP